MTAVGPPLSPEQLAQRTALPLKPDPVELRRGSVRLRPLDLATDPPRLHLMSCGDPVQLGDRSSPEFDPDALIWRYLAYGPFHSAGEMAVYLQRLDAIPNLRVLVQEVSMVPESEPQPVGVFCLMSNSPGDLKIELGHIWLSPVAQGVGMVHASAFLALEHCFSLGYRRVEWKCDALNERSRRTALRLGFKFEGIQEHHLVVKNRSRDTAWYRLLEAEWPAARSALTQRLAERTW